MLYAVAYLYMLIAKQFTFAYSGESRSLCPFANDRLQSSTDRSFSSSQESINVDYDKVMEDIQNILNTSQVFWPADFGYYGPLMIRLAWHCAGSYRNSDGRGGCDGARIRFDPERSWPDNTNLDKALN